MQKIHIIGACHFDQVIFCKTPFTAGSNNQVENCQEIGGVASNIARNLLALEEPTNFSHVVGNDERGKRIKNYIENLGFEYNQTVIKKGAKTALHIDVHYHDGEFLGGFSDMAMYMTLSAEDVDVIEIKEDFVLIDCNFSDEAIDHLIAKLSDNFLAMAPVSTDKAHHIVPHLSKLGLVVMTQNELAEISGISTNTNILRGLEWMMKKGAQNVIIMTEDQGIFGYDTTSPFFCEPIEIQKLVSSNGCENAFYAGVIWAYRKGYSLLESIRYGYALFEITAGSRFNVSQETSQNTMRDVLPTIPFCNRLTWRHVI